MCSRGWTFRLTATVMSAVTDYAPSLAVRRSPWALAIEKAAVVFNALALANVTVPGPLNFVHPNVRSPGGMGRPSSLAVPFSVALAGSVMDWSGPALADGT